MFPGLAPHSPSLTKDGKRCSLCARLVAICRLYCSKCGAHKTQHHPRTGACPP